MKRKILNVKDKKLRKKSKRVDKLDKKIKSLIADLKDTLKAQVDPEGVGLAAPQIGKNLQVFVMKSKNSISVFINPKILSQSKDAKKTKKSSSKGRSDFGRKKIMEGCLSLPNFYGPLKRPDKIKLEFQDESGKKYTKTFEGFEAQVIQHEIDHLKGVLFVDRLLEKNAPLYELVNGEWREVELN